MSNMSYCRFRNTRGDLRDCRDNIFDALTGEEAEARIDLLTECIRILDSLGFTVIEDDNEKEVPAYDHVVMERVIKKHVEANCEERGEEEDR